MPTQPLNTCPPGSVVNISDIPEFQGLTVIRVSDSGVTVSGGGFKDVVLSGGSPATVVQMGEWPEAPTRAISAPEVSTSKSVSEPNILSPNDPLFAAIKPQI